MDNALEFARLFSIGRTPGGFAGIRPAAAFEISHPMHGAGRLRARQCVDDKIKEANCEPHCMVMTNRSLGVGVEAAESRP